MGNAVAASVATNKLVIKQNEVKTRLILQLKIFIFNSSLILDF
jgi:hypothetical protein